MAITSTRGRGRPPHVGHGNGHQRGADVGVAPAEELLGEGGVWRQESGLGGVYEAPYRLRDGVCVPAVRGSAWITAESELHFDATDPDRRGSPDDCRTDPRRRTMAARRAVTGGLPSRSMVC